MAFIGGHPLSKVNEIISQLDVFIIWDRVFLAAVAPHNFLFLCVDDKDDLFGLSSFFQLVMGFNKGIPKSFNLPDLLGALVKSWSPSHCFIMKSLITMSKKGTETPPPRRSLVMTSKSLVRWPSTYTALLKLVYRAIEVSSYSSGFRFVRNIPVKDGDLAVIYRYEYVTSHLFIKSKYFQAVVS